MEVISIILSYTIIMGILIGMILIMFGHLFNVGTITLNLKSSFMFVSILQVVTWVYLKRLNTNNVVKVLAVVMITVCMLPVNLIMLSALLCLLCWRYLVKLLTYVFKI